MIRAFSMLGPATRRRAIRLFGLCLALSLPGLGAAEADRGKTQDAPALRAVLAKIETSYVDPSRVDPQKMLWAAAAALDREIPEVLLESQPGNPSLTLRVADAQRSFEVGRVRSLATLSDSLREVLRFVDAHRRPPVVASAAEYAAIVGILETLDPHSAFLDPAEARAFATQLSSQISGVGMVLDWRESPPVVRSVMPGGSAREAGVAACDRILAVDGRSTFGVPIEEVIDRIVGPIGTEIWISFEHEGAPREFVLTRRLIELPSVSSRLLEGGVGFIRIDYFGQRTSNEVDAAVASLRREGATAWILDLRANPGGLMREALGVASLFVTSGPLITLEGERGGQREVQEARPRPGGSESGPLAVLIAPETASAAEILAAALQNRNRAVVLGRTSFGKGSVQVLVDQDDGSKLKLTVAHYLAPGGVSLQSRGVVPDLELLPVPAPRPGRVRLSESESGREAELGRAFTPREAARRAGLSLRYLAVLPDHEEEVEIARQLLVETRPQTRAEALGRGREFVDTRQEEEETRIVGTLAAAGVDWSTGSPEGASQVSVRCVQRGIDETEGRAAVECEVRNDGPGDAHRVVGRAPLEAFDLAGEEIVLGRAAAGTSRTVTILGALAADPSPRVTYVPLAFSEQNGASVDGAPLRVEVPARARPPEGDGPSRPEIRIAGDARETIEETLPIQAAIVDRVEVLDAWIRVSNSQARIDRKKVGYFARPQGEPGARLEVASRVPLSMGLNQIGICARGKAAERCETVFVFRRPPASP